MSEVLHSQGLRIPVKDRLFHRAEHNHFALTGYEPLALSIGRCADCQLGIVTNSPVRLAVMGAQSYFDCKNATILQRPPIV